MALHQAPALHFSQLNTFLLLSSLVPHSAVFTTSSEAAPHHELQRQGPLHKRELVLFLQVDERRIHPCPRQPEEGKVEEHELPII